MDVLEYPFDPLLILKKKKSIRKELLLRSDLIEKKIAIFSGSTIGDIEKILELFLLKHGIRPIFYIGDYSRFYEEIMFDTEKIKQFAPDLIYIHTSNKNIEKFPSCTDSEEEAEILLIQQYRKFEAMWNKIQQDYKCPIIQNNFEYLSYRILGNSDGVFASGAVHFIQALNTRFAGYARENSNFYIHDIQYLSAWYGLEKWSVPSFWYLYKYALNMEAIPLFCHSLANIIKSIYGKNKKVLTLDLDNTLWGGIIGDDGKEGIQLGIETAEGMAYIEFQKYIKELSKFGILLTVCSKNEEEIAKTGFEHSSSVLHFDDFVLIKANWDPKHMNLKQTKEDLNVMLDSFVFIDDNPAERAIVKKNLPEVCVPNMTIPEEYLKILDGSGFFEVTSISNDDKSRKQFYQDNLLRKNESHHFQDYKEYLRDLEMCCKIEGFCEHNMERVTQLINKTNQFNFTTIRYTESEVRAFFESERHICFSSRLIDKYGDNGIVSVLIGKIFQDMMVINLWVMSCRVFKRDLELAMFDYLVKSCQERGIKKIQGIYIPSSKNMMLKDFYANLGFTITDQTPERDLWEYNIPPHVQQLNKVMEVEVNEQK